MGKGASRSSLVRAAKVLIFGAVALAAGCSAEERPVVGADSGGKPLYWRDGSVNGQADGPSVGSDGGAPPADGGAPDFSLGPPPDRDGDGHCPSGAVDPKSVCKSFRDCDDTDPTRYPSAKETCANEGVDNDCDGDAKEVDENGDGKNDLAASCSTGLPGVCAFGKRACGPGDKLVCSATVKVGQRSETCNGLDDDCDKTPDNGSLCTKGNTCEGKSGCRCNGSSACSGSAHCCSSGCRDLSRDESNCGKCGVSCGSGETCSSSRCTCGSTTGSVGGGAVCSGGSQCVGGSCLSCNSTVNLAPQATAYSSGGGGGSYGPQQMNDGRMQGSTCDFHWVSATSSPGGKWVEYRWSSAVQIGRIAIDTLRLLPTSCTTTAGRTLAGATVQVYSGGRWVTVTSTSGRSDDWTLSFSPRTTTRLRLYDVRAPNYGFAQNPAIFEWRVFCK